MDIPEHQRGLGDEAEAKLSQNTHQLVADRMRHFFEPDKNYTAATWSDKFRVLPAGGRYSRWQTSRTPYMYEIAEMMASRDPAHRFIAISKSSQLGLTALATGEMLRLMHTQPTSILYYRETQDKIDEWKRTQMGPSLRLPPFNGRRDIEMRGDDIYFPGGYLIARGTGSSNAVAGTTARVVIGDEVAKFAESLEAEGDFFSLASQRASTFGDEAKAILFSTPKEKSENEGSFFQLIQRGDVRQYSTPCRHCKQDWFWEPEQIVKYEESGKVHYGLKCPHCEQITRDGSERVDAMQRGKWLATQEPRPGFVSYEVSGMLSWRSLEDIYHMLEDAVAGRGSMVAFENTVAGRFYDPPEARRATADEVKMVMTKQFYTCEPDPIVPDGVCFLTMALDVQGDRLPWEVKGWGPRFENWSISRGEIGYTADDTNEVVLAIKEIMSRKWKRQDGNLMQIRLGAIDYGYKAESVKAIVSHWPRINYDRTRVRVIQGTLVAVKGNNQHVNERFIMNTPGGTFSTGQRRRAIPFMLGVEHAKFELYRALKAPLDSDDPVFGRAHAPSDYPDDYWPELVAEEIVVERNPKDGKVRQFFRPTPAPNEALDLHVYNRACASIIRADTWREEDWARAKSRESHKPELEKAPPPEDQSPTLDRAAVLERKQARRAAALAKRKSRKK